MPLSRQIGVGARRRRRGEERREVVGRVDVEREPGALDDLRLDAERPRALQMGKKLSSPKRSGSRSGGEQATAFEPRASREGASVTAGAWPWACEQRGDVLGRHQGNVGGQLQHPHGAFLRQGARAEAAGGGVAAILRLHQHPRAVAGASRCASGSRVTIRMPARPVARGERAENVLQHGAEQRPALAGAEHAGQALLGVGRSLTGTTAHRPDRVTLARLLRHAGRDR